MKPDLHETIKNQIQDMGFAPKKFLGQNFLINPGIVQKIVLTIKALDPSLIVEVGPGLGALTKELVLLKKPFYAVEVDALLCQYWKKKQISILEGDILRVDWAKGLKDGAVLAGNLPYQTAARLVVQCCPGPKKLKGMALMLQKEVAQKVLAQPRTKGYGLLSVLSQCFWEVDFLLEAGVSDFYPRPKVAGRVLIFRRKKSSISDPKGFLSFVKLCFSQRRKKLLSRLQRTKGGESFIEIFTKTRTPSSARAEELSPARFAVLFNMWKQET